MPDAENQPRLLTREQMRADIAKALHEDQADIGEDDNLADLGLDSVRAMLLVQKWADAGARITFAELAESPTLGAWWALVARHA